MSHGGYDRPDSCLGNKPLDYVRAGNFWIKGVTYILRKDPYSISGRARGYFWCPRRAGPPDDDTTITHLNTGR